MKRGMISPQAGGIPGWRILTALALVAGLELASANEDYPNHPPGAGVFLAANPAFKGAVPAGTLVAWGALTRQDADEVVSANPAMIILKKAGHAKSSATLRFDLSNSLPPGEYALWTRFSQGGDSAQKFQVAAGAKSGSFTPVLTFTQSAKSWETVWRQAPERFVLYPGETALEVTLEGMATQQKLLGGFFLVREGKSLAGLTAEGGKLRRAVYGKYCGAKPAARLWVLEGVTGCPPDPVLAALLAHPQLADTLALKQVTLDRARDVATRLTGKPTFLLVSPSGVMLRQYSGPFQQAAIDRMLEDFAHAGSLVPQVARSHPAQAVASGRPLVDGRPAAWLFAGPWTGSAGQSVWGLGAEGVWRPNPDDPFIITDFDSTSNESWQALALGAGDRYRFGPVAKSYVWSKAAAYASLYVWSDSEAQVALHLAHTGIASHAWLNGVAIEPMPDGSRQAERKPEVAEAHAPTRDHNDQGGQMTVQREGIESPKVVECTLRHGWNRMLIKWISQATAGESLVFSTRFTRPDGGPLPALRTSVTDPTPSRVDRATANRFIPLVHTASPFNLVHPQDALKISVDLGSVSYTNERQLPYSAFHGTLEMTLRDYDGKEVARQSSAALFPGVVTFDFGKAPPAGYYSTQLVLLDDGGNLVTSYPPDGFSVIGGVAAQNARKDAKKMAVTYYFLKDLYQTIYFPYMQRIGIFRNIGGMNGRSLELYEEASRQGLSLSADLWNYRDPKYIEDYVKETAPFVDSFKSFNEIDIRPDQRGTPAAWVAKAKLEYETIRKHAPKAVVLGGSLVRPASDGWFGECLKLGLANYHDVWDVHCYPKVPPVLEGSLANGSSESERGVLKVMNELGMKNTKPFWIGETGARNSHGLDATRWQADTVAKMVACAMSRADFQKIGFLIPWRYSREKGEIGDIEAAHLPAEASYYTASALIDGFSYTRLVLGEALQAAQFGPTTMLWTTHDTPQSVTITPRGQAPWIQVDVVGRVTGLAAKADGTVAVTASTSPIYILSLATYAELTRFAAPAP